jgi:bifunctional non-homologous end joining protein LigD
MHREDVPRTAEGPVVLVELEGRDVRLTNLDKVLWPSLGTTKGELIRYYVGVAPVLLPHIARHPLTLHRFPDGVEGSHWYETRSPPHPPWVPTHEMGFRSGKDVHAPVVDDLPSLVWAANAGAIELHPYLGTVDALLSPTAAVFDLDPGSPASLLDAARVGLLLRELLHEVGLASFPKTSGGKGLHVYVPLNTPETYDRTKAFARTVARHLTARNPDGVTDLMPKARRAGKVFVDWSQNDPGKSTVAPYSMRGLQYPTVSMPVTWDEVGAAVARAEVDPLVFLASDVAGRLDRVGDVFEPVRTEVQRLPG